MASTFIDVAATLLATAKVSASLSIALSTRALCRSFGSHLVVDAVTLAINDGEMYGLLGRNGAGESTLIKMMITLLPPSSGSATVGGFDVGRQT